MDKMEIINKRNEKGQIIEGNIPYNKGKQMLEIQMENHYKWKGGTRQTMKRILKRMGADLSYCRICKEKKRTIIHHIDGDEWNNQLRNLAIICYYCHNAIHGNGRKTRFQEGHIVSLDIRKKISQANKDCIAWNKGLKGTKEEQSIKYKSKMEKI